LMNEDWLSNVDSSQSMIREQKLSKIRSARRENSTILKWEWKDTMGASNLTVHKSKVPQKHWNSSDKRRSNNSGVKIRISHYDLQKLENRLKKLGNNRS
jgi:hypothetical protein